uniref:Peroxidase n=1 Tax=Oryza sativa subsp. japonica TaxID=39947 RepID=Q5U1G9_ORYSJ|nr:TPA: class III peroxidase 124 precursor [Oryza sativa Japonica Group]
MAAPASSTSSLLLVLVILLAAALISHSSANAWPASSSGSGGGGGGLSAGFYDETCPSAQDVVRRVIQDARVADPRIPASLIRLHFHDCFVNGCDASILLDEDLPSGIHTEKRVPANDNSARGFDVVDDIKCELDKACPGVVSCADILAIAAQVSVDLVGGGPRWRVQLGRRDATATNIPSADNLPGFTDTLEDLVAKFDAVGLDHGDLVALQGAHTFGRAQCLFTRENCTAGQPDDALENLDPVTPDVFDNNYYGSLLRGTAKLPSDQVMLSDDPYAAATTAPFVRRFAGSQKSFFRSFAASMIKMGNISPLTGMDGQIRQNCRRINTYY